MLMKIWDMAWFHLLHSEAIETIRYVDNSQKLMYPLKEGWYWNTENKRFQLDKYEENITLIWYDRDQSRSSYVDCSTYKENQ